MDSQSRKDGDFHYIYIITVRHHVNKALGGTTAATPDRSFFLN